MSTRARERHQHFCEGKISLAFLQPRDEASFINVGYQRYHITEEKKETFCISCDDGAMMRPKVPRKRIGEELMDEQKSFE